MGPQSSFHESHILPTNIYRYQPLSDLSGVIRLFYASRNHSGTVRCDFVSGDLRLEKNSTDSQETWGCNLDFYAISYTWGIDDRSHVIDLDGRPFSVTPNLFAVLEDICVKQPDSLFWADAICIDQGNHVEKSHQVRQMAQIYEAAVQVFIYLGRVEEALDLDRTMKVVKEFDSFTRGEYWASDSPLWPMKWNLCLAKIKLDPTQPEPDLGRLTASLERLLNHSWFTRVWILQEVAKARSARVYIAPYHISSRTFALLPRVANATVSRHIQAVMDVMPGPARQCSWWQEDRSLARLLEKFCDAKATMEIDKIYALLGICSDPNVNTHINLDYGRSECLVIQDVIAYLCRVPRASVDGLELGQRDLFWNWRPAQDYPFTYRLQGRRHTSGPASSNSCLLDDLLLVESNHYDLAGSESSSQVDDGYGVGQDPETTCTDLLRLLDDLAVADALQTTDQLSRFIGMLDWHRNYASIENISAIMWFRWSRTTSMGRSIGVQGSTDHAGILVDQATIHQRLKHWMGAACLNLLYIALWHSLSQPSLETSPAEDPLAMILRQTDEVGPTLQLLQNSGLVQFIPGSVCLIDALWLNKSQGSQILKGVLRDISKTCRPVVNDKLSPRIIADFELINIWRRFEDLDVLSVLDIEMSHDFGDPITITARSMSILLPRDEPEAIGLLVARLFRSGCVLPQVNFSWGGMFGFLTRCELSDLRHLIRASTATAQVIRRLVPSLVARRLESTQLAEIVRLLVAEEMKTRGHIVSSEVDDTESTEVFVDQIWLSGFSRDKLSVKDRVSSWTALTAAAALGNISEAQRLILSGEPLHAVDGYGLTALTWAIWSKQEEIVDILTQAEARIYPNADGEEQAIFSMLVDVATLDHVRMSISRGQDIQRQAFDNEQTFLEFMAEMDAVQPWAIGLEQTKESQRRGYVGWRQRFQNPANRHDDLELE